MAFPTLRQIQIFSSRQVVTFICFNLLSGGCIFATYHLLYNSSCNTCVCDNTNKSVEVNVNHSGISGLVTNVNFSISYVEKNLYQLDQMDPRLIEYTRVRHLTPPSSPNTKHNFEDGYDKNPHLITKFVMKLFRKKLNGTFIEIGSNDGGGATSHTVHLEMLLGWSGLIVQCNPTVLPYLRSQHRKAWIADACLSRIPKPEVFQLSNPIIWTSSARLKVPWHLEAKWSAFDVQAIPLYTILAALGLHEVDYFSLDIEGQDVAVLRSFPFDLVKFKMLIIEEYFTSEKEHTELDNLLKKNGYMFLERKDMDKIYLGSNFYKEVKIMMSRKMI